MSGASSGDTINVPAGSCTWTDANCTGGGCINMTTTPLLIVGSNPSITLNTSVPALVAGYSSSGAATGRFSGFTFSQGGSYTSWVTAFVNLSGSGTPSIRIDNITFNSITTGRCIVGWGGRGVFDTISFGECRNYFAPTDLSSATEWAKNVAMGSADAWFIENSTFSPTAGSPDMNDQWGGSRVVLRYNNFTGSGSFDGAFVQNHGYDSVDRGGMWREVYNNTFTNSTGSSVGLSQMRGGTGVFYNNVATGSYWVGLGLTDYRSCTGTGGYSSFAGYCVGGTYNGLACSAGTGCSSGGGTCSYALCNGTSPADGNTGGTNGYACIDQIGRRGPSQNLDPAYEWNNTMNGSPLYFSVYSWGSCSADYTTAHIQQNRDYYDGTPKPGYTAYTCPHPLTGLPVGCSATAGTSGYNTGGDVDPPIMTRVAPTYNQVLTAGTTSTTVSLTTDETATCKWSLTDIAYASMANTYTSTGSTSHSRTQTGLTNGGSYTYYTRCIDTSSNADLTSLIHAFTVASVAPPTNLRLVGGVLVGGTIY